VGEVVPFTVTVTPPVAGSYARCETSAHSVPVYQYTLVPPLRWQLMTVKLSRPLPAAITSM
jgi:hypothetical protein